MTTRVLLVQASAPFRRIVANFLRCCRYEMYEAASLNVAHRLMHFIQPHILLLDIELNDGESHDLLREAVREGVPTMILSTRASADDRVTALRCGAEDYMVKPIDLIELRLRMRRLAPPKSPARRGPVINFGSFVIDMDARSVRHTGARTIQLSPSEFRLTQLFMEVGANVLTREKIARAALGRRFGEHSRAVDMLVSKLRRKLDPTGHAPVIWAVRGEGYRFAVRPSLAGMHSDAYPNAHNAAA